MSGSGQPISPRWFPEFADPGLLATTWPGIEVHRDRICGWLAAEVSAATVAQRLRDEHGVSASESSGGRFGRRTIAVVAMVPPGSVFAGSRLMISSSIPVKARSAMLIGISCTARCLSRLTRPLRSASACHCRRSAMDSNGWLCSIKASAESPRVCPRTPDTPGRCKLGLSCHDLRESGEAQ